MSLTHGLILRGIRSRYLKNKAVVCAVMGYLFLFLGLMAVLSSASICSAVDSEEYTGKKYGELRKDKAYNEIYSAFKNFDDIIDVEFSDLTPGNVEKYLTMVLKDNPELFFIGQGMKYDVNSEGFVSRIYPKYTYTKQAYKSSLEFCEREVQKIIFLLDSQMSHYDIALFVHDYLCTHYEYDTSGEGDNMYDFLRSGRGNCQGYTFTYTYILRKCGLNVSFAASDSLMHIWNVIELEDKWFHVDVTWDDPVPDVGGTAMHKYFLFSDLYAQELGHNDYYTPGEIMCTSEEYDRKAIENIDTPLAYFDGKWYCADNTPGGRSFCEYIEKTNCLKPIFRFDSLWKKGDGKYYIASFSSTVALGDYIYFNGPECIYIYDSKNNHTKEFLNTDGRQQIRRLEILGRELIYYTEDVNDGAQGVSSCMPSYPEMGDINGDGAVNVRDILHLNLLLDGNIEEKYYKHSADFNFDGQIDENDLVALRGFAVDKYSGK